MPLEGPSGRAPRRVLILGGTGEAARLARALDERHGTRVEIISSLAGRTAAPGPLPGLVRIGGFGGAVGLARYLETERIELLIDATHPFADEISRNAVEAAGLRGTPRLALIRPPWPRHPLDRWIEVGDVAGAARVLPRVGKRVFLTLGASEIAAFGSVPDTFFLVRMVDPPAAALPLADCAIEIARGPFAIAGERRLIAKHRIDALVAKASGGEATQAKLVAAREADLPVVMIRRPPPPRGDRAHSLEDALAWIEARL